MIIIIDDEEELAEILSENIKLMGYPTRWYNSWASAEFSPGDVIIHDKNGVGCQPPKIDGVFYVPMSGDVDGVHLKKPFTSKELKSIIFSLIGEPK